MKVTFFGEILGRLSTGEPLDNHRQILFDLGGAELNVAINYANLHQQSTYITMIPEHNVGFIGQRLLRKFDVKDQLIKVPNSRLGLYYLEKGFGIRNSEVIYDRQYSAFATRELTDLEVQKLLTGDVFYTSGISLSVSEVSYNNSIKLAKAAKKRNMKIIFDSNYRSKLITLDQARKKYSKFMPYVDVIFANHLDMINIHQLTSEQHSQNKLQELFELFQNKYPNIKKICFSTRVIVDNNVHQYQGSIYEAGKFWHSKEYHLNVLDRIGTGDAFASGILYGMAKKLDNQAMIDFAAAAAAYKHTILGDFSTADEQVIKSILKSSVNLDVSR